MLTAEAIRETFDEKFNFLRSQADINDAREPVRFARETQRLVEMALPYKQVLAGEEIPSVNEERVKLLAYLDCAILKAEVMAYNLEWDVDLKMEPEE